MKTKSAVGASHRSYGDEQIGSAFCREAVEVVEELLSQRVDLEIPLQRTYMELAHGKDFTTLHTAMIYGSPEIVCALLGARANAHAVDSGTEWTVISAATRNDRPDNLQTWLQYFPDLF